MIKRRSPGLKVHEQSQRAIDSLREQSLTLPRKPEEAIPELPQDITDVDDTELMSLFGALNAWSGYIAGQAACAQIDERAAQRSLDLAEARSMARGWDGTASSRVAIAKAQMNSDPEVVALREDLEEKHAYRKLVEVLASNVDRDAAFLSREITRRTSDRPRASRYTT